MFPMFLCVGKNNTTFPVFSRAGVRKVSEYMFYRRITYPGSQQVSHMTAAATSPPYGRGSCPH